jgi:hypothetical protein
VQILSKMMPTVWRYVTCAVLGEVLAVIVNDHCKPLKSAFSGMARGMLLCGIGLTVAAFLVCVFCRKLVRAGGHQDGRVAPAVAAGKEKGKENEAASSAYI